MAYTINTHESNGVLHSQLKTYLWLSLFLLIFSLSLSRSLLHTDLMVQSLLGEVLGNCSMIQVQEQQIKPTRLLSHLLSLFTYKPTCKPAVKIVASRQPAMKINVAKPQRKSWLAEIFMTIGLPTQ